MKFAFFPALLCCSVLALAACKDQIKEAEQTTETPAAAQTAKAQTVPANAPDDIVTNSAIAGAKDWAKSFPQYYNPLMACVKASPNPVLKVVDVLPLEQDMLMVVMEEKAGPTQECMVHMTDIKSVPKLQPGQAPPPTTTQFYPASATVSDTAGEDPLPPPDSCLNNLQIKTHSGQKLGWLSFPICADAPGTAQPPQ